jgi:hypothetical protein
MRPKQGQSPPAAKSIWSHAGKRQLPEFFASIFAATLLEGRSDRPVYFCSPWISDFPLFENGFGQFGALFPECAEQRRIRFSDFLVQLSEQVHIRIVTTRSATSRSFLSKPSLASAEYIQHRYAEDEFHEKGILTPQFYVEGSMNITFYGVHIRGEKVVYHTRFNADGRARITAAYLEFDRRWDLLDAGE